MIYAEQEKDECPFVSINNVARGRILPSKQPDGISESPPYQAKMQAENRTPSTAETQKADLRNAEKEPDLKKDSHQEQEFEEVQTKTMTAAASGVNENSDGGRTGTSMWAPGKAKAHNPNPSQGSGHPLPGNVQTKMEQALGTDFKDVRLHHDAQSATSAERLGAKAFTHKTDIYFNQGAYQPTTAAGEHLLAHELTHVKQQKTVPGLQSKLQAPGERDRYEQEADAAAAQVGRTSPPSKAERSQENVSEFRVDGSSITHSIPEDVQLAKKDKKENSNWFMNMLSGLFQNIPGYDLLALVIARDPISGREVKRNGVAYLKAIVGLIPGGSILLKNLEQAKVVTKAVTWFKAEFKKLNLSLSTIKNLFQRAWDSLSAWDILSPGRVFEKIKHVFTNPIQRIMNFITSAGSKLQEIVLEGALTLAKAPVKRIMEIFNKGKGVLGQIISDPAGFLSNLLKAIEGGLNNFKNKIGTYLQSGLAGWLFGALSNAGITLPEKLNLSGIFSLIAQILGVTWQAIKARVIKLLGPTAEKVMEQVKKTVTVVAEFITKGPIALFDMAREFIGDLKTRFFDSVIEWVRNTIIFKGVQKLISMFNPVGAIVQAIITIGSAIKFFIERAKQITAFANAVFDSVTEIAAGNLKKAVIAVENSLAKALPVAIGFMANLVGIGGIASKIKNVIKQLRKPIDNAVEKIVGFVADQARALLGKITGADKQKQEPPKNQKEHDAQVSAGLAALDGEQKKEDQDNDGALTDEEAKKAAQRVKRTYPVFKSVTPVEQSGRWVFEYVASKGKHEGFKVETESIDSKTKRMDRVIKIPAFKIKQKFIKAGLLAEYKKQVKGQEEGLNKLTIKKFLQNRGAYMRRLEEQKLADKIQPSGRDPKASLHQERIREEALERKIREFKEQGLKPDEAEERANAWIKTQAALHDPDQIAGGDPENVTGLGNIRVNSSIGAQWKTRALDLENAVNNYIIDRKLPSEDLGKTRLNVKLSCEVV